MKKHDIYDGTEFSTEGVKYWHENAAIMLMIAACSAATVVHACTT